MKYRRNNNNRRKGGNRSKRVYPAIMRGGIRL